MKVLERTWVLGLVLLVPLGGCAHSIPGISMAAKQIQRFRPKLPDTRPDIVELHYIFLEDVAGSAAINADIWESDADEQSIPLDTKAALAENGFRMGKVGSRLSPALLALLEKQEDNHTGRRHQATSGQLAKIEMTPELPTWNVFQVSDGHAVGDQINDAQGMLLVTPTNTGERSVMLDIRPEIEFGPREQKRVPSPDLTEWQIRSERQSRKFPELRTSIELTSGEYAIIGTWDEKSATVGHRMFVSEKDGVRTQSLLLIRVVRPNREELLTAGYDFDDFFLTPIKRTGPSRATPVLETVMASKRYESRAH